MRGLLLLCLFGTVLGQEGYSWNGPGGGEAPPSENVCLTDVASCGCCLMQRQMHHMEEYFNASMNELRSSIGQARAVLTDMRTSRSAFSVALTDTRACQGSTRAGEPALYQVVFLNLGGNYDQTTGVFTVPRAGVYSLALTVYSDSGAPGGQLAACADLEVNGVAVAELNDKNGDDQEDSATVALALELSAGDRVRVYLPQGCIICDNENHYNTFTGFLLYATD